MYSMPHRLVLYLSIYPFSNNESLWYHLKTGFKHYDGEYKQTSNLLWNRILKNMFPSLRSNKRMSVWQMKVKEWRGISFWGSFGWNKGNQEDAQWRYMKEINLYASQTETNIQSLTYIFSVWMALQPVSIYFRDWKTVCLTTALTSTPTNTLQ